ncbi:caspase family protein [Streptomyces sp. RTGN2]|uniref:caspase family protein n=1 Tax=Streptomyces sp. RTGN2 TaxID=3016525 RepID=UPI0025532D1D|nr:caspase family protein [Streptomyces sp. RTGN2]
MHADPRYHGLLIGNATFPSDPHALPELRGPLVDLKELGQALTDDKVGMFSPGNVLSLPDKEVHELRKHLDKFFSTAVREDVLLLYYSGHGRLDEHGELYLCASDTMLDTPRATALSAAEINNMIRSSAAATVIIVLDCCHSGAWKTGIDLAAPVAGKGRYVLTSNRSTQLARDAEAEGQPSPFTGMLVRGLRHAEATGHLTVNGLYRQVHHWITEDRPQRPQLSFIGEGDIAIAGRGKKRRRKHPHQHGNRRPLTQAQAEQDDRKQTIHPTPKKVAKATRAFKESWTGNETPWEFGKIQASTMGLLTWCSPLFPLSFAKGMQERTGDWTWFWGIAMPGMPLIYGCATLLAYLVLRERLGSRSLYIDSEGITVVDSSGDQHIPWAAISSVGIHSAEATSDSRPHSKLITLHLKLCETPQGEPPSLYRTAGWPRDYLLPDVCRGPELPRPDRWVPVCVLGPMSEPRRIELKTTVMAYAKSPLVSKDGW